MRKFVYFVLFLLICSSCVRNSIDDNYKGLNSSRTLKSILTKSSSMVQEDTIVKMSKLQSDVDNLMMGRVIMQDSVFILSIKKEDALFLGVSEEVYENYLDFVDRLNESLLQ